MHVVISSTGAYVCEWLAGVVRDCTGVMRDAKAPSGSHYYAMSDVDGFSWADVDSVHLRGYSQVKTHGWMYVRQSSWSRDEYIKIWVTNQASRKEIAIVAIQDLEGAHMEGHWIQLHTKLCPALCDGNAVRLSFGLQSLAEANAVLFDHFQITGVGQKPKRPCHD